MSARRKRVGRVPPRGGPALPRGITAPPPGATPSGRCKATDHRPSRVSDAAKSPPGSAHESQNTASAEGATKSSALPKGWRWTTLGEVTESMKNGIYKPASAYADDGLACLRMHNIDEGKIVWRNAKRMRRTPPTSLPLRRANALSSSAEAQTSTSPVSEATETGGSLMQK